MEDIQLKQLFSHTEIGLVKLSHRVVMAPLTRMRSEQPGDIPGDLMVEYYGQRASEGGLIIAEATSITKTSRGYLGAPGIYSDAQVVGWRKVVDVVHAKGGLIFLQLWHVGRVAHVDLNDGASPIAPSAMPFDGAAYTQDGWVKTSPNRELKIEEITSLIGEFRSGAERAKSAGFDGVELHSGNGYLLDQFLQDGSNKRTDIYGGSIENRARLLLQATEAVISVWGADRVGVRISPSTTFNSMFDSNPEPLFDYVAEQLSKLNIAYLHIIEPRIKGSVAVEDNLPPVATVRLRKRFKNTIIAAGGFEPATAEAIIESGDADLVAFGRHFISNPDLPERIKLDLPLNPYNRDTFYGGDSHGYTDYSFYKKKVTAQG